MQIFLPHKVIKMYKAKTTDTSRHRFAYLGKVKRSYCLKLSDPNYRYIQFSLTNHIQQMKSKQLISCVKINIVKTAVRYLIDHWKEPFQAWEKTRSIFLILKHIKEPSYFSEMQQFFTKRHYKQTGSFQHVCCINILDLILTKWSM